MELYLTREQVREIDRRAVELCGMSSLVLMENAARGAVDVLERLGINGPVFIACGKGNNGGDGLAMARHLELRGYEVRVGLWAGRRFYPPPAPSLLGRGDEARMASADDLLVEQELSADAAVNYRILRHCRVRVECFGAEDEIEQLAELMRGAAWIVDALFGTGFQGTMRSPFDAVVRYLNGLNARRLAVDLPSGLDANTGEMSSPTFRADHTVTFVGRKIGFRNPNAAGFLGEVHVADIGISPASVLDPV